MFVENNGVLSGIDSVPYSIIQSLKLYWIQMQMSEAYSMVQQAGLNLEPLRSNAARAKCVRYNIMW